MIPQPIPFNAIALRVLFFDFISRNTAPSELSTDTAGEWRISVEAVQRLAFDAQTPETFADGLWLTLVNHRAFPENYADFDSLLPMDGVAMDFGQMELNRLLNRTTRI